MRYQLIFCGLALFSSLVQAQADCVDAIEKGRYEIELDVLYWKAVQAGLAVGVKNEGSASILSGNVANQPTAWDPGFRLGLGYVIPHDQWHIDLLWTQFHSHADESWSDRPLSPTWLLPGVNLSGSVNETHAHWRLHMGFIDALLQKDLCTSPRLMISPSIGVRYAWIRQKYNLSYAGGILTDEVEVRMKNKFWGVGVKCDIGADWQLGKGFSVVGSAGLSLLLGAAYIHQDEDETEQLLKVISSWKNMQEIVEMAIGLKWAHLWNRSQISLKLLWENLWVPEHNQLVRFTSGSIRSPFVGNMGDLTVQGWTLGLYYRF